MIGTALPHPVLDDVETLSRRERWYVRRQLRRRGAVGTRFEDMASDILQVAALLRLQEGEQMDWPALRRLLDRAVYRVMRDHPIRTLPSLNDELTPDRIPAAAPRLADEVLACLQPGERLLLQLKQGTDWYRGLPEAIVWDEDDCVWLEARHGVPIEEVTSAFLSALRECGRRTIRRVPAGIIAWLLGRAGGGAVDRAYSDLRRRLREQFGDEWESADS